MDYEKLAKELCVGLRAKRTQMGFSKLLGFKTNRVHRWESGELALSWADLQNICIRLKIPLETICRKSLFFMSSDEDSISLVRHLMGSRTQNEIASRLGISRSMVSRWKSGEIAPLCRYYFSFD